VKRSSPRHNGKENPIGIETNAGCHTDVTYFGHNGKENPIGIETHVIWLKGSIYLVTMEKKTR